HPGEEPPRASHPGPPVSSRSVARVHHAREMALPPAAAGRSPRTLQPVTDSSVGPVAQGSQILSGVDHRLDAPLRRARVAYQRLDGDDALALPACDLRPVVRLARVRLVLVLFELLAHRRHQVVDDEALLAAADAALEGHFLRASHHGLDHRVRDDVADVEELLLAAASGDIERLVGRVAITL